MWDPVTTKLEVETLNVPSRDCRVREKYSKKLKPTLWASLAEGNRKIFLSYPISPSIGSNHVQRLQEFTCKKKKKNFCALLCSLAIYKFADSVIEIKWKWNYTMDFSFFPSLSYAWKFFLWILIAYAKKDSIADYIEGAQLEGNTKRGKEISIAIKSFSREKC